MSDDLRELYQEVILDHGRNPRNFREIEAPSAQAFGNNPLCGDQLTVYVTLDADRRVEDVAFKGRGCAISVASASLMTEALKGKSEAEARKLFEAFHALCTGEEQADGDQAGGDNGASVDLDKLQSLSGVSEYPTRVKCATLAWHTLTAALDGDNQITTE